MADPFASDFDAVFEARRKEADEFYASVIPASLDADAANVMRQALAGMLWSKQYYYFDVNRWLDERGANPFEPGRRSGQRNEHWDHMYNANIVSMPDKWEYPWYAAWDLAFHVVALTLVDEDFGKQQLNLMLHNTYIHPSGQLPAYEWNFGDVNPPVHAFSTIFTYKLEVAKRGEGDLDWLEPAAFTSCPSSTSRGGVNRKEPAGQTMAIRGADSLGSRTISACSTAAAAPLPTTAKVSGTSRWHCMDGFLLPQNMLSRGSRRRARGAQADLYRHVPKSFCRKHFLQDRKRLAARRGQGDGMWDEGDGFFYDVLRLPDGRSQRLKVRSVVGKLASFVCGHRFRREVPRKRHPEGRAQFQAFLEGTPPNLRMRSSTRSGQARPRRPAARLSALDETRLRRGFGDNAADENGILQPSRHPISIPIPPRASLRISGGGSGIPGPLPALA